ncbi:AAA family ATPase [Flexivirga caeni]|uniref:Chromosome segregation protein SMC n=1 Tax=Flexivirga caeni TaxID=2294115 RepID=A0A3M9MGC6_9MICO|nr:AAA family ATPase [Flexivirga caeni]RNI23943.1 chromosome segregation protein SMC [Flexivirga caeni]
MTESPALGRIHIEGFASIADLTLDVSSPVTVLIGPNGSGKSNIVTAIELIAKVVDGGLQDHVARRGGLDRMLHESAAGTASQIVLEIRNAPVSGELESGYRAVVWPDDTGEALLREQLLTRDAAKFAVDHPYDKVLATAARESRLAQTSRTGGDPRLRAFARHVLDVVGSCRVYHFDDVSSDAPPKRASTIGDDVQLRSDAGNIAAYLHHVRDSDPYAYDRIVGAIRTVTPFFGDFVLEPTVPRGDSIRLRWRQRGLERVFTADEISDGTLRFICLATLLLGPERPATIILDEPELGLHPFAIHQLAAMVRSASIDRHRVILATQSVTLLSQFTIEETAVVQRGDDGTTAERVDPDSLAAFLDDFSLGAMWEMNLLGGRPRLGEPSA